MKCLTGTSVSLKKVFLSKSLVNFLSLSYNLKEGGINGPGALR
jgi:hypothetical protein